MRKSHPTIIINMSRALRLGPTEYAITKEDAALLVCELQAQLGRLKRSYWRKERDGSTKLVIPKAA
jgi:hypothetical protein